MRHTSISWRLRDTPATGTATRRPLAISVIAHRRGSSADREEAFYRSRSRQEIEGAVAPTPEHKTPGGPKAARGLYARGVPRRQGESAGRLAARRLAGLEPLVHLPP